LHRSDENTLVATPGHSDVKVVPLASILMLLPESPFPPRCGNAWRDAQQVAILRDMGFRVRLVLIRRRPDLSAGEEDRALADLDVSYATVPMRGLVESTFQLGWRKASYLLGSARHASAWWMDLARPGAHFVAEIDRDPPSAIIIRSWFLHYIPELRRHHKGPIVVDCHDSDVHLAEEAVRSVRGVRKIGPWLNLLAVRRCCASYLHQADEIWVVSPQDAVRCAPNAGDVPLLVVPSGMREPVGNEPLPGTDSTSMVIANYGYQPNDNGVRWLLQSVWPVVRKNIPDAVLHLVGGNMSLDLQSTAAQVAGVKVHGMVPDLDEVYREVGLIVVPILEGGGTRLKIVEAWSRGKAVLTTTKGAEGLPSPEACTVLADAPLEFAAGMAQLMLDRSARRELGARSLRKAREELSYTVIRRLIDTSSKLAALTDKRHQGASV
jgi:glycosyltransferase involved in cell wall biosynthesis